jgi:hypothetical protein
MTMTVRSCWDGRGAVVPIACLVLLVTAGCASQFEMTEVWRDPSFNSGPVRNLLVVGVRKDPVRRRLWEDAFTQECNDRGVTATPSYQLFPDAPPDTQDVIEAVRKSGYDAVLSSVRLPNETHSTYFPGNFRRQPVTVEDYFGRFHTYLQDVQDPGHTETDEVRLIETDIWTTSNGGHLIWSGTLRTLESVNSNSVDAAVSKDIMPELEKQGLVPGKKKRGR